MSHLEGRLGIDMHYLVTSYHGEGKNLRNQLSDKFDEVEQDFLSYHSLYSSLLCESLGGNFNENFCPRKSRRNIALLERGEMV